MSKEKKVAVYTGTRNLYGAMVPAVKSLLYNSDVDEVWLFAEDDAMPEQYGFPSDVVHVRNVSGQTYFDKDGPNMSSGFTYMAMMRAALALEFPKLRRILALDVDTIAWEDVSGLWEIPLGDNYLAAAKEPCATEEKGFFYANIGVCLYNLAKLRDGTCTRAIELLNSKPYKFLEQDAFNEICAGSICDLSSEYNATMFTEPCERPKIIHFAGKRYWNDHPSTQHFVRMPWAEVLAHRRQVYGK